MFRGPGPGGLAEVSPGLFLIDVFADCLLGVL